MRRATASRHPFADPRMARSHLRPRSGRLQGLPRRRNPLPRIPLDEQELVDRARDERRHVVDLLRGEMVLERRHRALTVRDPLHDLVVRRRSIVEIGPDASARPGCGERMAAATTGRCKDLLAVRGVALAASSVVVPVVSVSVTVSVAVGVGSAVSSSSPPQPAPTSASEARTSTKTAKSFTRRLLPPARRGANVDVRCPT